MTPTLKGWCAKYIFQCLCLPIPFLLIASITDLYDDSDYRCLFSFLVCERPIAINGIKATGRSWARDRDSWDRCIRASLPFFIVIRSLGFFSIVRILIRLKGWIYGWNTKNNSHRSTGRDTRRKACRTRTPMRQSPGITLPIISDSASSYLT